MKGGDAIAMTRTGRESQGARQIAYKEPNLRKKQLWKVPFRYGGILISSNQTRTK